MADTATSKGSIVYRGSQTTPRAKMVFQVSGETPIDKAKMVTLEGVFALHTDCQAVQITGLDITRKTYTEAATGLTDRKAILVAQEANGRVHKWGLPGIKVADCEKLPYGTGERVKSDVAATLIAAIATATGLALTPCECYVVQSK